MQTFALALLGAFALERLRWRWSRFLSVAILTIGFVLTFVVSARLYFTYALDNTYDKDKLIAQMQLLRDAVPTTIHQSPPTRVHEDRSRPTLERIRARGVIEAERRNLQASLRLLDSGPECSPETTQVVGGA